MRDGYYLYISDAGDGIWPLSLYMTACAVTMILYSPMPSSTKTNFFYKLYLNVTHSIAFFPTVIALSLFGLSLVALSMDQFTPDSVLSYQMQIKNIIYPDSARALLGAIAGGTISLVVFSFSMVMVVLNQTASNYSPRVLPSLIGKKFHQIIMGFYLGTIAYTFMVLSSIESKLYTFTVPSLAILINALLSLVCLGLFLAFVRSISESIQIGNIINSLYQDTCKTLTQDMKKEMHMSAEELPDTASWTLVRSNISGYFDSINERQLLKATRNLDVTLRLLVPMGRFVNRQDPFFCVSRPLSQEEKAAVFQAVVMRHQEIVVQNYVYGFKQLTEIAVKALSPGINDPGTAIQAIDRLTDLMVLRMALKHESVLLDKQQQLRVIYQEVSVVSLFYLCFSAIKNYTTSDVPVFVKLLQMIKTVYLHDGDKQLASELASALYDTTAQFLQTFDGEADKAYLMERVYQLLDTMRASPGLESPGRTELEARIRALYQHTS